MVLVRMVVVSLMYAIIICCTRTCIVIVNGLNLDKDSIGPGPVIIWFVLRGTVGCTRFGPSSVDFWQLYVESPGTGSTFCSGFQILSSPVLSRLCSVLSCQCPVLSVQCPSSTSIPVYPVNPVLSVHPVQYIQYIRYISSTFLQVFIRWKPKSGINFLPNGRNPDNAGQTFLGPPTHQPARP